MKKEIDKIYTQEIQKKLVFLKQKYWAVGGKATKLLAYKLKKKQADSALYSIKNPVTKETEHKLEKIQQCLVLFYQNLYSQEELDNNLKIDNFLKSLHLPEVTETQNNILKAEVTPEEINLTFARLKVGSSPGADGFTTEWYKGRRDKLMPTLLMVYNWVLGKREMPPSWREAIISLIPKEGKDRLECDNLRPSVINMDYRVFTSITARRLERCLPHLIHLNQTGFIKQRQTQDNIRRTLHIIRQITENKIESALLSLDAQNAFDAVRWKLLYKVLSKFGFHEDFIKIIQTLYDKPIARIKVNGDLIAPINLQ